MMVGEILGFRCMLIGNALYLTAVFTFVGVPGYFYNVHYCLN